MAKVCALGAYLLMNHPVELALGTTSSVRSMPNGKPGDHPYTDIVLHGLRVYSEAIDRLVREIAALSDDRGRRELQDMLLFEYNEYSKPDLARLERVLSARREQLRKDATERGWEA